MINNPSERQIFSVSQLNRSVRHLIETQLPLLWVEGEISNFARPASGHWYLTLKDDQAQVRCAMFRNSNQRVGFKPANGTQVLVRCRAGLYEGRGEYQLVIEHMEEAGFGALQRQFEQLKQQLSDEGLFDNQHKKPMPDSVSHIGVITSATGAAVKDVLSVLERRFPSIKVSIFPTAVQGEQAAKQIVEAIGNANQLGQCDALIVGRGGGSLEDRKSVV
jgi:exodeoxyribonuclease VII large subunit